MSQNLRTEISSWWCNRFNFNLWRLKISKNQTYLSNLSIYNLNKNSDYTQEDNLSTHYPIEVISD